MSTDEECTEVLINVKNAGGLKEDLIRVEFILDSYFRPDTKWTKFDDEHLDPYSGLAMGSTWADNSPKDPGGYNSLGIKCIVHLKDADDTLDWDNYDKRIYSIKDLISLFKDIVHYYE